MGEPAIPSVPDRAATLTLARAIVDAETNDELWPTLPGQARSFCADLYGDEWEAVYRLAQDLVDTRRALEAACEQIEGEGYPDEADKLRRLEMDNG